MPSPRGTYIRLSQSQRDAIRAAQVNRLLTGDRTGISGGGRSGSKNFPLDPNEILFELDYADGIAAGQVRPQKVSQVLTRHAC